MDEEAFIEWLMSLPEEDQVMVMQQMGLDQANESPYSFGDYAPELSGQEYDLTGFGGEIPPDFNSKGEAMPFGLDQRGQILTQQKNYNALLADNMTGALAGPGAYGPDAFVPREVYEGNPLDTPGRRQAEFYTEGQGGFESLIADAILNGDSPSQAVAKALQLAQMPDSEAVDPALRAQRDAVLMSLPPARVAGGPQVPSGGDVTPAQEFAKKYDVDALYNFADQIGEAIAKDPRGGYTDPETGIVYAEPPKQEWSGAAQKYLDLGLPFPTDNYNDPKYLDLMAPVDEEGNAARIAQTGEEARLASEGIPSYGDLGEMERLLSEYMVQSKQAEGGLRGQAPTQGPGPKTGLDDFMRPVAGPDPYADTRADLGERKAEGQTAGGAPLYFKTGTGEFNFGSAGPGYGPEVPASDYTGTINRELARLGMNLPFAGRISQDTIQRGKGQQEQARQARSRSMDARQTKAQEEKARMEAAGTADALAAQGRTPLTDAMLKRLLAQRNQGLYG